MSKITQKIARELIEQGFLTENDFAGMVEKGMVSQSARSTRPEINVPNEHKQDFTDKAYDALVEVAKAMNFDHTKPTANGGVATLYIKGSGKARAEKDDAPDEVPAKSAKKTKSELAE